MSKGDPGEREGLLGPFTGLLVPLEDSNLVSTTHDGTTG